MNVALGTIESWASQVRSTMASLPTQLEQAAPDGGFADVLAQAAALLDGPAAAAPTTGATSGGPAVTGAAVTGAAVTAPVVTGAAVTGPTAPGSTVTGSTVVQEATRFLGVPYVWGGDTPSGFDCSGLVQYVYAQLGVSLPRTSEEQALAGTPVASLTQAQPGDLVFFSGSDGTPTSPGHVGIYVGDGKMIDAPHTGTSVEVQPVSSAGEPVAIRRVLPGAGTSPAGLATVGAAALTAAVTPAGATASATPTSTGPVAVPVDMAPLFASAGAQYGVSPTLLAAVARQESGFTPAAVSSAGAEGMMQIMPSTATELGITPFTPAQAVGGAAQLISGYIHQFGSVPLALAAYSAGPSAVEEHGGIPPDPQTQHYVTAIMTTIGAST